MKNFAALVLLFFCAGCSSGLRFQDTRYAAQPAPADKARIFFLRPDDSQAGARWARLDIDGAPVGKLAREKFLVVDAVPDKREIATDEGERRPGSQSR